MKFIYLSFQENNTQDQKIHVWLSPQRKQQHNPGDSNLVYLKNQTKEGQCKAARVGKDLSQIFLSY